jgi:hypothetical protein
VRRAWQALPQERRLAAIAAIGLFLTLFLPWYQRHFFIVVSGKLEPAGDSQTGWAAFSFVEAAVLLVSAGVLTLLFHRAEGRAFHLPGGDGFVIMAAGLWTCVLVVWRIFDKQGATSHAQDATTYGIEWGIFIALGVAAALAYAGSRIRLAHQPEPPLPGEEEDVPPARPRRAEQVRAPDQPAHDEYPPRRRARAPRPVAADPKTVRLHEPDDHPTRPTTGPGPDERPTRQTPGPSTAAARSRRGPDDQMTIPLDKRD